MADAADVEADLQSLHSSIEFAYSRDRTACRSKLLAGATYPPSDSANLGDQLKASRVTAMEIVRCQMRGILMKHTGHAVYTAVKTQFDEFTTSMLKRGGQDVEACLAAGQYSVPEGVALPPGTETEISAMGETLKIIFAEHRREVRSTLLGGSSDDDDDDDDAVCAALEEGLHNQIKHVLLNADALMATYTNDHVFYLLFNTFKRICDSHITADAAMHREVTAIFSHYVQRNRKRAKTSQEEDRVNGELIEARQEQIKILKERINVQEQGGASQEQKYFYKEKYEVLEAKVEAMEERRKAILERRRILETEDDTVTEEVEQMEWIGPESGRPVAEEPVEQVLVMRGGR